MSQTLITCEYCQRVWDGFAQCPCWMYLSDDSDDKPDERVNIKIEYKKTPLELAQEAVDTKFNTRYKIK